MPIPPDKPLQGLTVLVVDDELAQPLARLIDALGGSGVAVTSMVSARQYLADHPDGIDCFVADLLLAGENGADLIRESRIARRGMPAVLVSGYGLDRIQQEALECAFLQKPFEGDDLASAILEAIGKADTDPPPQHLPEFGDEELGTTDRGANK